MTKPLHVAFCGPAGAGKSTQAKLLRQKYKGDVLSFAAPVKKVANDLFGEQMDDPVFARKAYQQVGVFCRNVAGAGFWVEKLVPKVSPDRNCFVDDLRFMNEYHALKRLGFVVIKLSADTKTLQERRPDFTPTAWEHESEQGWVSIRPDLYINTEQYSVEEVHSRIVEALPSLTAEPVHP